MADDELGRYPTFDLFVRRICGQHCGRVSDNRETADLREQVSTGFSPESTHTMTMTVL
jgi:hypothetical protein